MASSFSPVRVKAATQEAAIEQAIHMTGATRADMEIEVLEETEKGVTIRVAPVGSGSISAAAEPAPSAASPMQDADIEDVPNEEIEDVQEEDESTPQAEEIDDEDDEEFEDESAPLEAASETVRVAPEVRHASAQMKEHACAIADEILERMGLEARAEIGDLPTWCLPTSHEKNERARDVPRAFMKIEGEDVGILIGKHGNTLQSFQYLLNLTLNNAPDENASEEGVRDGGIHVVVDAGEYRDRRAGALERQALDAASRAKRDRRSVRLDPMPGHERRLVHLALYEDKEIATSSEGREPWRRVVIAPAGMRVESRDESGQGRREYSGGGNSGGGNSGGGRGYGNRGGNSGGYGNSGNSGGYGNRGGQSGYGGNSGGSGGNRGYGNSGGGNRGAGRGR